MGYQETKNKMRFRLKPWVVEGIKWAVTFTLVLGVLTVGVMRINSLLSNIGESDRTIAAQAKQIATLKAENVKISTELRMKEQIIKVLLQSNTNKKVINLPAGSVLKIEKQ